MKDITLSADDALLDQAERIALSHHKTLEDEFRKWLADYTAGEARAEAYDAVMKSLSHVKVDRKCTRDEMNER